MRLQAIGRWALIGGLAWLAAFALITPGHGFWVVVALFLMFLLLEVT